MANLFGFGENEPILKSAEENGDRLGTFAIKVKNLFSDLYDTLNSFSWTAATTSADGFMSAEDKAALDDVPTTYLPLSGGTLSGNLTISQILSFLDTSPIINSGSDTRYLRLGHGTGSTLYSNGSSLYLYAKNNTINPGAFILHAYDGAKRATLEAKPDGKLTWNGEDVLVSPGYFFEDLANKSVPNNSITNLGSFTLTKGLYLVYLTAAFANNTTGYRQLLLSSSATGSSLNRYCSFIFAPCPSTGTGKVSCLLQVTASSATYYINVYQNSGSALNVTGAGYQYMKIRGY